VSRPEWDDEDDDLVPDTTGPFVPADERWWRHPSEMAMGAPIPPPPTGPMPAGGGRAVLVLAATVTAVGIVFAVTLARIAVPERARNVSVAATSIVSITSTSARVVAPSTGAPVPSTAAAATTAAGTTAVTAAATSPASTAAVTSATVAPTASSAPPVTGPVLATAVSEMRLVAPTAVLAGATDVTVALSDGTEVEARVLAVDDTSGMAVLEPSRPVATVPPGGAAELAPGDVVHVGDSEGPAGEVVEVGVNDEDDEGTHRYHLLRLRLDTPPEAGAVLVDDDGKAVALCLEPGDDDTVLAAPIELARSLGANAAGDGQVAVPWLGATVRDHDGGGAAVEAVGGGGPAEIAGLKPGDVIVNAGGRKVRSMTALVLIVRDRAAGSELELTVQRGEERLVLTTVIGTRPADG
jgi:S1-C subfamily serine protease